ncbi:MAG: ABC transporter substrate-binding protein [Anaerolineaceae bacterium]|nr:ABC transporter substrate-binding protein [Formivibrio sp.]MDR3576422.1 ABC transporter substrate-binding protein [Anaerolineaceae bacterium]
MIFRSILAFCMLFLVAGSRSYAGTPIKISYQPALYGVTIEIAKDKGWFQQIGLDPSFVIFPTGAPQIAAAAAGDWDVGTLGAPPAILGAARIGLLTIGIATAEGGANVLLARGNQIAQIKANPSMLKGKSILVPTNSTAEYAAWACIKSMGLSRNDVQWVNLSPPQLVSAFGSGSGALAAIFTPYAYTLEHVAGAQKLCSAKDVGLNLYSTIVVRADYAKAYPSAVARFLATYMRAVVWEKMHPQETEKYLQAFYDRNGVELGEPYLHTELTTDRQQYGLDQQIAAFNGSGSSSPIDTAFDQFEDFMIAKGSISNKLSPDTFISAKFLQQIKADPKLAAWANFK